VNPVFIFFRDGVPLFGTDGSFPILINNARLVFRKLDRIEGISYIFFKINRVESPVNLRTFRRRFRAKRRPKFLGVPMLVILPLVFNWIVHVIRSLTNTLGLWLLLSLGFTTAIAVFVIGILFFFIIALIVLAAQYG
jgi:hypothetical protein